MPPDGTGQMRRSRRNAFAALLTRSLEQRGVDRLEIAASVGVAGRRVSEWTLPHAQEAPRISDVAAFPEPVAADCLHWLADQLGYHCAPQPEEVPAVTDYVRSVAELQGATADTARGVVDAISDGYVDRFEASKCVECVDGVVRAATGLKRRLAKVRDQHGEPVRKVGAQS